MSFAPINSEVLASALSLYEKTNGLTAGALLFIVSLRVLQSLTSLAPASSFAEIFVDLVKFLGASHLFPQLIKPVLEMIAAIAARLHFQAADSAAALASAQFAEKAFGAVMLEGFLQISDALIFTISHFCYSVLVSAYIAISPVIFLVALYFGLTAKLALFLQSFLALALWPVVWNLLGALALAVFKNESLTGIAAFAYVIVIALLQIASPFFSYFLLAQALPQAIGLRPLAGPIGSARTIINTRTSLNIRHRVQAAIGRKGVSHVKNALHKRSS